MTSDNVEDSVASRGNEGRDDSRLDSTDGQTMSKRP